MTKLKSEQFYQLHAIFSESLDQLASMGSLPIELGRIKIVHKSGRDYLLDTQAYFWSDHKVVAWFKTFEETFSNQPYEFHYNITEEDIINGDVIVEVYTGENNEVIQPKSLQLDIAIDGKLYTLDAKPSSNNIDYFKTIKVVESDDQGEFVKLHFWTVTDIIKHINADRNEDWQDYDEFDWHEGWKEWCAHQENFKIADGNLNASYFQKI
ncbi:hypothetical protein LAZ44_20690 [Vibrio alginolyticus]|jgi:hypothetical protein|uniref:hypothetical protein n=1 Tax=Vibrio TaxID=662 RepID=UPI000E5006DE|nr:MULTISPECIES: hypothetical protein [Vibrio]HCG8549157.1 hypothetical protein [Vibrio parahaemolyticus]AXT74191.1 hypothetical protein DBX26_24780 [Vibrio sp. dhg]MCA2452323.1 hypothetical protein [Vibrio alginolyticus]MCA2476371.1 hypothetical protein [Vibrio alginolyticus]MDW2156402.1 hypothetical protein [Vibrio sp. 2092]